MAKYTQMDECRNAAGESMKGEVRLNGVRI